MDCSSLAATPPNVCPSIPRTQDVPTANPAVLVCGIDSTKLTFGEWWRSSPGLVAIIGWCSKICRARILDAARVLIVRDAAALECPMADLNEEVRAKVMPQVETLRGLGFGEPRAMRLPDAFTNREIVLVVQLHCSTKTLARTVYSYPLPGATSKKKTLLVGFLTAFADGQLLCTDKKQPAMISAPTVLARWDRGDLATRSKAHEKNIEELNVPAVCLTTPESVWRICDEYEKALAIFSQSRGLYNPLSDAEGANVAAIASPEEARRAATLAELVRLQTVKRGSMAGIIVLLVSLAVFAGMGTLQWSWKICAMIAITLFVHELGHYIAMRWFNYRELRMFFIPLFGAAVTGKHHNVPGWKKAVVSLMGPLPGIVIGAALAIFAAMTGNHVLASAALLVIGLNLFNLLPILPLDGGWFWNAVLFCRHRWLEAGFKALAALTLMAGALVAGQIWFYLGLSMMFAVPKTLRLGAVAARLRQDGWRPSNDDLVSNEAAETILSELKQESKNPPAAKTAASDALTVFEHLNARPPSWLQSFGLSAGYCGAIVVAVVGIAASLMVNDFSSGKKAAAAKSPLGAHVPVLKANFHGEIAQAPVDAPASVNGEPVRRIISTFPNAAFAAVAFNDARSVNIPADRVVQFGQTIIAVAPLKNSKAAQQIGERLTRGGGEVLDTGAPLTWTQFDLQFSAQTPEAARRIHRQLQTYFAVPTDLRPIAPWQDDPSITIEQREAFMKAGATFARVLQLQKECNENPEVQRLTKGSVFHFFQRHKAMVARWQEIRAKREQLAREAILKLRASRDPELDPRVIDLALRQPTSINDAAEAQAADHWRSEMRQLLTGRKEDDPRAWTEYVTAEVIISGDRITLHSMSFASPEDTLPLLASHLVKAGCTDLRYGFYNAEAAEAGRLAALSR